MFSSHGSPRERSRGARPILLSLVLIVLTFPAFAGKQGSDPQEQWGQWRGPSGTGVAPRADPPVTWSEQSNVRWKAEIPGRGHSTPIVWGHRVFVTTAVPEGEGKMRGSRHADGAHDNLVPEGRLGFVVLALDRRDGTILWQRTLRTEHPHQGTHVTGSFASNSPVTDGEHLFVSFGSRGLYSLDMNGELIWQLDLGDLDTFHGHGEGSSPALHGDTLLVNWDHQGDSFLVALDKRNGKQRWKVARDEITSWSTPLVVEHAGKPQVIVSATRRVRSYDLADGRLIWECGGLSRNVVASPVAADGLVYVANSYDTQAMLAIRLEGARGDITGTDAVVWSRDRNTPYVPSPLLYDGMLLFLKHNQGLLTNLEAASGRPLYGPQRLEGIDRVFASPVGAANRVYIVDRSGNAAVVRRGPEFELLARNRLDDSFSASPAIAGDELFLRGQQHLYCIAEPPLASAPSVSR